MCNRQSGGYEPFKPLRYLLNLPKLEHLVLNFVTTEEYVKRERSRNRQDLAGVNPITDAISAKLQL